MKLRPTSWTPWTPAQLLLVAGLIGACTQIGHLWTFANWLVGVPEVAYAARTKADTVDEKFERYLLEQQAYTKALNAYVANQQQQQQVPVSPFPLQSAPVSSPVTLQEQDAHTGKWYCCPMTDRNACFAQRAWTACP